MKKIYTDQELEKLWNTLKDVPMNPNTEKIEEQWFIFKKGTDRIDIWHWFDKRYSKGISALLYN